MKIVKPNAQLMEHNCHPYQFIEKVGRTCYKSEDKITPDSAVGFVRGLAARKHGAMLEHEFLYLAYTNKRRNFANDLWRYLEATHVLPESREIIKYMHFDHNIGVVGASFRTWIQFTNFMSSPDVMKGGGSSKTVLGLRTCLHASFPEVFSSIADTCLKREKKAALEAEKSFLAKPIMRIVPREEIVEYLNEKQAEYKKIKAKKGIYYNPSNLLVHTILFTCDRGVSHEFVRHRPASFGQESTRYCNYTKGQFGSEITVIEPMFWKKNTKNYKTWKKGCELSEQTYFELINNGATAQEARSVLPNSLKTEIFITATEDEWQHIVNLRYHGVTGAPHPQMKEVMALAYPLLVKASNGRIK